MVFDLSRRGKQLLAQTNSTVTDKTKARNFVDHNVKVVGQSMEVPHLRSQAAAAAASKCVSARPKMQTELHPHQANAIKSKANFGYQKKRHE